MAEHVRSLDPRVAVEFDVTPRSWFTTPEGMGAAIAALIKKAHISKVTATRHALVVNVGMRPEEFSPDTIAQARINLTDLAERAIAAAGNIPTSTAG